MLYWGAWQRFALALSMLLCMAGLVAWALGN